MDIFPCVYYLFVESKEKIFHFLVLVFHWFIMLISYYYFKTLKIHKIVQNYFKPFNSFLERLPPFCLNATDFVNETIAFKSISLTNTSI